MKFLAKVVDKYNKLEIGAPQWVKEYVTPAQVAVPSTPTAITGKPASLDTSIATTLGIKQDADLAKKKEELDVVYKQVADALKKKAVEATNKLKQTSTDLTATPSTTTSTTPTT
jgi:hypothetical protein